MKNMAERSRCYQEACKTKLEGLRTKTASLLDREKLRTASEENLAMARAAAAQTTAKLQAATTERLAKMNISAEAAKAVEDRKADALKHVAFLKRFAEHARMRAEVQVQMAQTGSGSLGAKSTSFASFLLDNLGTIGALFALYRRWDRRKIIMILVAGWAVWRMRQSKARLPRLGFHSSTSTTSGLQELQACTAEEIALLKAAGVKELHRFQEFGSQMQFPQIPSIRRKLEPVEGASLSLTKWDISGYARDSWDIFQYEIRKGLGDFVYGRLVGARPGRSGHAAGGPPGRGLVPDPLSAAAESFRVHFGNTSDEGGEASHDLLRADVDNSERIDCTGQPVGAAGDTPSDDPELSVDSKPGEPVGVFADATAPPKTPGNLSELD